MKTKITFLFGFIALLGNTQFANAQEPIIPIAPQGQVITINVPGVGNCTISINSTGEGITIKQTGYTEPGTSDNDTDAITVINTLGPKTCKNASNESFSVSGEELYQNTSDTEWHVPVMKHKDLGPLFSVGSNGYSEATGDDIYVNDAGIMGVSRDTGKTWTIDTAGFGYMSWFTIDTAQNVWAINSNTTALYYQNKDSNVWHRVISFPSNAAAQKIFIDRNNRFFIGTNGNGVYYSYDRGQTWTQGIIGLSSVQCGQMCDDYKGNIYLLNSGGSKIYRSVNGGAMWTEPPGDTAITNSLAPTTAFVTDINSISGDTAITAGTQFGLYYTLDSGRTWVQENKGLKEGTLNGFWKCNTGRMVQTSSNGLFWVNKGSSVWNKPLPANGYGSAGIIYGDTSGNIYVNGLSANSAVQYMKSVDNGTTWQPDTLGLYQITIAPTWWVDQYGNEHNSNNNYTTGATVYRKTPGNPYVLDTSGIGIFTGFYQDISSFGSDGASYLYMSGYLTGAKIYRRPILGGKWMADTTGSSGIHFLSMAHDGNHTMIGSPLWQNAGLYYRSAGIWTSIPYPSAIPFYDNVSALACDSSGGTLAAFSGYDFIHNANVGLGVYCTHDYGVTWNYVGLNNIYINQLVNCGGDSVYALTQGKGVYALTCSGIVVTSNHAANTAGSIQHAASVYPNPNDGNFILSYNLPDNSSDFRIIDIMGKVIYNSKISNTEGKQIINASQLANGVYFWQVYSGNKLFDKGKISVVK